MHSPAAVTSSAALLNFKVPNFKQLTNVMDGKINYTVVKLVDLCSLTWSLREKFESTDLDHGVVLHHKGEKKNTKRG